MANRFVFPPMRESVLANGLRTVVLPDHEQEGMVVALQLPFGRFADPAGLEGCAEICVGLMQKGTGSRTFEQFSETFENRGATLFADLGEEHAMIGVKMLSRFKDELFPCFWDMIIAPRFDARELTRLKQEMITALRAETVDPGTIANHHFYHELAGPLHPAGRHHSVSTIRKLKREHIVSFFNANVIPEGCTLVIAGDFSDEWFTRYALSSVEEWKPGASRIIYEAPPVTVKKKTIRFVEKNDLTQVSLVIGQEAPGEMDAYRNPIALANYVFGAGNFSSRLMTRIRSSAGRTYGIASHITAERRFGALTIATSTQNRQLAEVVGAVLSEFGLLCSEGVTREELENAKRFVIGNMAFQLEGITNLVEKLLWLYFYRRTTDYIEHFEEMINGITLESVNEAVRRTFDPERLIIIGVGRRSEVASQLAMFGTPKQYHYKDRLR